MLSHRMPSEERRIGRLSFCFVIFTARFARDAKNAEGFYFLFSGERPENKNTDLFERKTRNYSFVVPSVRNSIYCFPPSQRETIISAPFASRAKRAVNFF
jgi:hypothetical protein